MASNNNSNHHPTQDFISNLEKYDKFIIKELNDSRENLNQLIYICDQEKLRYDLQCKEYSSLINIKEECSVNHTFLMELSKEIETSLIENSENLMSLKEQFEFIEKVKNQAIFIDEKRKNKFDLWSKILEEKSQDIIAKSKEMNNTIMELEKKLEEAKSIKRDLSSNFLKLTIDSESFDKQREKLEGEIYILKDDIKKLEEKIRPLNDIYQQNMSEMTSIMTVFRNLEHKYKENNVKQMDNVSKLSSKLLIKEASFKKKAEERKKLLEEIKTIRMKIDESKKNYEINQKKQIMHHEKYEIIESEKNYRINESNELNKQLSSLKATDIEYASCVFEELFDKFLPMKEKIELLSKELEISFKSKSRSLQQINELKQIIESSSDNLKMLTTQVENLKIQVLKEESDYQLEDQKLDKQIEESSVLKSNKQNELNELCEKEKTLKLNKDKLSSEASQLRRKVDALVLVYQMKMEEEERSSILDKEEISKDEKLNENIEISDIITSDDCKIHECTDSNITISNDYNAERLKILEESKKETEDANNEKDFMKKSENILSEVNSKVETAYKKIFKSSQSRKKMCSNDSKEIENETVNKSITNQKPLAKRRQVRKRSLLSNINLSHLNSKIHTQNRSPFTKNSQNLSKFDIICKRNHENLSAKAKTYSPTSIVSKSLVDDFGLFSDLPKDIGEFDKYSFDSNNETLEPFEMTKRQKI